MAAPLTDRFTGGLRATILNWLKRVDYLALYPGTIVKTNSDGTCDFQPNSPNVPGLGRVPLRAGLPGTTVKTTGGYGYLGFENGDPDSPYVMGQFGVGTADLVSIVAATLKLTGAIQLHGSGYLAKDVVREGDNVTVGTQTGALVINSPKSGVKA